MKIEQVSYKYFLQSQRDYDDVKLHWDPKVGYVVSRAYMIAHMDIMDSCNFLCKNPVTKTPLRCYVNHNNKILDIATLDPYPIADSPLPDYLDLIQSVWYYDKLGELPLDINLTDKFGVALPELTESEEYYVNADQRIYVFSEEYVDHYIELNSSLPLSQEG